MKHFLYLRGHPGVGKITVAKILEKELGWRVFWFHDLKNAVFNIVGDHRIPRLMDGVTAPVIRHLLDKNENIIYVRPSPDAETVATIAELLRDYPSYAFHPVRLTASYESLVDRVSKRNDHYRICSEEDLRAYVDSRPVTDIEGEHIVDTNLTSPEGVAAEIRQRLAL